MSLTMSDNTNSAHVTATNNHGKISSVKFDEINDLASLDRYDNSVLDSNQGIRIADGAAVVCDKVGDTLSTSGNTSHLTKLVL